MDRVHIDWKRLGAVLAVATERDLRKFAEWLLLEKLGPRTLQSLALIAEVVHGTPSRSVLPILYRKPKMRLYSVTTSLKSSLFTGWSMIRR